MFTPERLVCAIQEFHELQDIFLTETDLEEMLNPH